MARQATASATLRAYKADWTHYATWCAAHGFIAVPADPATVGAYLASLAGTHPPDHDPQAAVGIGKEKCTASQPTLLVGYRVAGWAPAIAALTPSTMGFPGLPTFMCFRGAHLGTIPPAIR